MQDLIDKLKKNKKLLVFMVALVAIIIIWAIIFLLVNVFKSRKITYESLEEKVAIAAKEYLNDYPDSRPNATTNEVMIDTSILITNEYLKNLDKYVDDVCGGYVLVTYKDEGLSYRTFLDCNSFKTRTFRSVLDENSSLNYAGDGIYELDKYKVYRGQNPTNYLKLGNAIYRIVKYNDEEIQIIIDNKNTTMTQIFPSANYYDVWDDRYNTELKLARGINSYNISIVFNNLSKFYNKYLSKYQSYLNPISLCAGKRNEADMNKGGKAECNNLVLNSYIGLLPVYDYLNASLSDLCIGTLSPECQNYNYLNNNKDSWWTITANSKNSYEVYYVNYNGIVSSDYAGSKKFYRFILNLNSDILYKSGNGTLEDPYIIR